MKPTTRDTGLTGAGKGDKSRVQNCTAYRKNYAAINWRRNELYPIILDCDRCGDRVNLKDATKDVMYLVLCPKCTDEVAHFRANSDPI